MAISHMRSLLISLQNSHENIEAKGELFRNLEGKTSIGR